jgi:sortase A
MHRLARIVSTALITAGLVVLLDVGIALAWQEPVSSLYGWLKQRDAANELRDLEARYPTAADLRAILGVDDREAARILARRFERQLHRGEAIGRIKIPRIGLDIVVVQGTDTPDLEKGPGHYPDTPLPGLGGTTAIAGHRTTYLAPFRDIDKITPGDEIRLEMPYADFVYRAEKHEIVDPSDVAIVRPVGYERLVLTACHPLYSAAQRYAVLARLERVAVPRH